MDLVRYDGSPRPSNEFLSALLAWTDSFLFLDQHLQQPPLWSLGRLLARAFQFRIRHIETLPNSRLVPEAASPDLFHLVYVMAMLNFFASDSQENSDWLRSLATSYRTHTPDAIATKDEINRLLPDSQLAILAQEIQQISPPTQRQVVGPDGLPAQYHPTAPTDPLLLEEHDIEMLETVMYDPRELPPAPVAVRWTADSLEVMANVSITLPSGLHIHTYQEPPKDHHLTNMIHEMMAHLRQQQDRINLLERPSPNIGLGEIRMRSTSPGKDKHLPPVDNHPRTPPPIIAISSSSPSTHESSRSKKLDRLHNSSPKMNPSMKTEDQYPPMNSLSSNTRPLAQPSPMPYLGQPSRFFDSPAPENRRQRSFNPGKQRPLFQTPPGRGMNSLFGDPPTGGTHIPTSYQDPFAALDDIAEQNAWTHEGRGDEDDYDEDESPNDNDSTAEAAQYDAETKRIQEELRLVEQQEREFKAKLTPRRPKPPASVTSSRAEEAKTNLLRAKQQLASKQANMEYYRNQLRAQDEARAREEAHIFAARQSMAKAAEAARSAEEQARTRAQVASQQQQELTNRLHAQDHLGAVPPLAPPPMTANAAPTVMDENWCDGFLGKLAASDPQAFENFRAQMAKLCPLTVSPPPGQSAADASRQPWMDGRVPLVPPPASMTAPYGSWQPNQQPQPAFTAAAAAFPQNTQLPATNPFAVFPGQPVNNPAAPFVTHQPPVQAQVQWHHPSGLPSPVVPPAGWPEPFPLPSIPRRSNEKYDLHRIPKFNEHQTPLENYLAALYVDVANVGPDKVCPLIGRSFPAGSYLNFWFNSLHYTDQMLLMVGDQTWRNWQWCFSMLRDNLDEKLQTTAATRIKRSTETFPEYISEIYPLLRAAYRTDTEKKIIQRIKSGFREWNAVLAMPEEHSLQNLITQAHGYERMCVLQPPPSSNASSLPPSSSYLPADQLSMAFPATHDSDTYLSRSQSRQLAAPYDSESYAAKSSYRQNPVNYKYADPKHFVMPSQLDSRMLVHRRQGVPSDQVDPRAKTVNFRVSAKHGKSMRSYIRSEPREEVIVMTRDCTICSNANLQPADHFVFEHNLYHEVSPAQAYISESGLPERDDTESENEFRD
ncbi:hypothetical protein BJ508DRAFT_326803 [Ascobolus immersus RN42]|uniref:Uncharacterized protein n=1 Tax=Ascobolus immersus RN42 TaxID=1160509 RepID=A0A3N4IH24_ASCIM|nr:hypothetical protein BJ508DRAFT_326803 [Ascobolus immersus RN42]